MRQSQIDFSDRNLVEGDRVTLSIAGGTDVMGVLTVDGIDALLGELAQQIRSQSGLFSNASAENGLLTLTGLTDASPITAVTPTIEDGVVNAQLTFANVDLEEGDRITLTLQGGGQVRQVVGSDGVDAMISRLALDLAGHSDFYASVSANGSSITLSAVTSLATMPSLTVSLEDGIDQTQFDLTNLTLSEGDRLSFAIAGGTEVKTIIGSGGIDDALDALVNDFSSQTGHFSQASHSGGVLSLTGPSNGAAMAAISASLADGSTSTQFDFNNRNLSLGDRITMTLDDGSEVTEVISSAGLDASLSTLAGTLTSNHSDLLSNASAAGGVLTLSYISSISCESTATVALENAVFTSAIDLSNSQLVAGDRIALDLGGGTQVEGILSDPAQLDALLGSMASEIASQSSLVAGASASNGKILIAGLADGTIPEPTTELQSGTLSSQLDFNSKELLKGDRITLNVSGGTQVSKIVGDDGLQPALSALATDLALQDSFYQTVVADNGILAITGAAGIAELPNLTATFERGLKQAKVDFNGLNLVEGDQVTLDIAGGTQVQGILGAAGIDTTLTAMASDIASQTTLFGGASAASGSITFAGLPDGSTIPSITPTLENGTTFSRFDFADRNLKSGDRIILDIEGGDSVQASLNEDGSLDTALREIVEAAENQSSLYSSASVDNGIITLTALPNTASIPTATITIEDRIDQSQLDFSTSNISEGDRISLGIVGGDMVQAIVGPAGVDSALASLLAAIQSQSSLFSDASVNSGVLTLVGLNDGSPIAEVTATLDDGFVSATIDFNEKLLIAGDRITLDMVGGSQVQAVVGSDGNLNNALDALATGLAAQNTIVSAASVVDGVLTVIAVTDSNSMPVITASLENAVAQSVLDFNNLNLQQGDRITLTIAGGDNVTRVVGNDGLAATLNAIATEIKGQPNLFSDATATNGLLSIVGLTDGSAIANISVGLEDGVPRGQLDFSDRNLTQGDRVTLQVNDSQVREIVENDGVDAMLARLTQKISALTDLYSSVSINSGVITMDALTSAVELPAMTVAIEKGLDQAQFDFGDLDLAAGDRMSLTIPGGNTIGGVFGDGGLTGLLNALANEIVAQPNVFSNASVSGNVLNVVGLTDGSSVPQLSLSLEKERYVTDYDLNNLNLDENDLISIQLPSNKLLEASIGADGIDGALLSLASQASAESDYFSGASAANGIVTLTAAHNLIKMPALTLSFQNAVNSSQIDLSEKDLKENDRIIITLGDSIEIAATVGSDGVDGALSSLAGEINGSGYYSNVTANGAVLVLQESENGLSSSAIKVDLQQFVVTSPYSIFSTDLLKFENAITAMERIDNGLYQINHRRAGYGATMTRLEFAADNLANVITNATQSRGRISDADYAAESASIARTQIIQQAAVSMLTQANLQASEVLTLIK